MKGRSLNQQECLQLNQGSKVYVEANNVFSSIENGVYIKLKGTCFTNIKKEINVSRFSVTSSNYVNGYIKTFEYEEEKEMKEYTFKEVIAKIEDEQEYKCTADYANVKCIRKDEGDIIFIFSNEKSERIVIDPKFKFILVQKPVKFLEAVEAKKEGKTVYCVMLNGDKSTYLSNTLKDSEGFIITADEILLGEWYIE